MSLRKNIKLTVRNYDVQLSQSLKFWQNDILTLTFEIEEFGIEIINGIRTRDITPINPLSAIILVENPNKQDTVEAAQIVDNKVTFKLKKEHTKHVGITKLQIKLKDSDGCKITLPPFDMEIREPIGLEGDESEAISKCGDFLANEVVVGEGLTEEELNFNSEGELIEWQDGITPVNSNNLNAFRTNILELKSSINALKQEVNNNKANILKGSFKATQGQTTFNIPHPLTSNDLFILNVNSLCYQENVNYSVSGTTVTTPPLTLDDEVSWILFKFGNLSPEIKRAICGTFKCGTMVAGQGLGSNTVNELDEIFNLKSSLSEEFLKQFT
ncbi:hypothetical protein GNF80_15570 [Clostridium perfringens]|nr:hypothetical protein [Clostridium perfringens]